MRAGYVLAVIAISLVLAILLVRFFIARDAPSLKSPGPVRSSSG
jgi:hypothetical protein